MVGNGFNDLLAISSSSVGISTANSDKATYIASDIHLLSDSISGVPKSIKLARGMMKNLNYAFVFSSVYNLAGMSAAFMGFVSPVVAAILMPINSLVVGTIASRKVE
jgi:Cu+-exporting ATPase